MKSKLALTIFVLCGATVAGWLIWRELSSVENKNAPLPALENPRLVVKKSRRKLFVYDGERLVKTYKLALGAQPAGDKETEGDGKTPEGDFYVAVKNPKSKFYLSLGLSYPNAEHARRGLRERLISQAEHDEILKAIAEKRLPPQKTRLGGEIYLHGGGNEIDWTAGCAAFDDAQIAELFAVVPLQTLVTIEP